MNMALHGIENPNIRYKDSLAEEHAGEDEAYTLILANPPFAGSLDYESCAKDLLKIVKTKKTELLFLVLFLRLLKPGGARPSSFPKACCLDRLLRTKRCGAFSWKTKNSMQSFRCPPACSNPMPAYRPPFCFSLKPTPAARTTSGSTTCRPTASRLTISVCLFRMESMKTTTYLIFWRAGIKVGRSDQSANRAVVLCPKAGIAANGYDLSLNRYREVVQETTAYNPPEQILDELDGLETEIQQGLGRLRLMLREEDALLGISENEKTS